MVKGGKRYSLMSNDGKWFAHQASTEDETRTHEMCTSTQIMLTQIKSSLPQALNFERYPKRKIEQNTRVYPLSDHNNKQALRDNIAVFTHGVGRRKCLDERRQHNSHFCLCHDGADGTADETGGNFTAYQTDFKVQQAVNVPANARRFPRNHRQKSAEAALAQTGEQFMWFGRNDRGPSERLEVLAATNCSALSKP